LPEVLLGSVRAPLLLEMMRLAPALWETFADALTENVEGKRWNTLLVQAHQGTVATPLPAADEPKPQRPKAPGATGPERKSAGGRGKTLSRPKLRKRRSPRVKQHRARLGAAPTPAGGFWETPGEQIGDFSDIRDDPADAVRGKIVEDPANGPRRFNAC
jgi:hypothetical protein